MTKGLTTSSKCDINNLDFIRKENITMKQLAKKITGLVAVAAVVLATAFVPAIPVNAADNNAVQSGINSAKGDGVAENLTGNSGVFTTIVNTLLFIVGAVSVIMLIWGGIRYATSAGNSSAVTSAKNTIMYAIVGLIIAFLAFAIVNWVLAGIGGAAS